MLLKREKRLRRNILAVYVCRAVKVFRRNFLRFVFDARRKGKFRLDVAKKVHVVQGSRIEI